MKFLILNAGSSSLKFRLYQMPEFNLIVKGVCERIGLKEGFIDYYFNNERQRFMCDFSNHIEALNKAISAVWNDNPMQ